jgi:hypothetical protein
MTTLQWLSALNHPRFSALNHLRRWTGDDRDVTGGYQCVNSRTRHGAGGLPSPTVGR